MRVNGAGKANMETVAPRVDVSTHSIRFPYSRDTGTLRPAHCVFARESVGTPCVLVGVLLWWAFIIATTAYVVASGARRRVLARIPRITAAPHPEGLKDPRTLELCRELEGLGFSRSGVWLFEPNPGVSSSLHFRLKVVHHDVNVERTAPLKNTSQTEQVRRFLSFSSYDASGGMAETNTLNPRVSLAPTPKGATYRRFPKVRTATELLERHHAHVAERGLVPVSVEAAAYGDRLALGYAKEIDSLIERGTLRTCGDGLALSTRRRLAGAANELSLGTEDHPLLAKAAVALVAGLGTCLAVWIVSLPEALRTTASTALLAACAASAFLWTRKGTVIAWAYACTPVAIVLAAGGVTSWIPWCVTAVGIVIGITALGSQSKIDSLSEREGRAREELSALGVQPITPPEISSPAARAGAAPRSLAGTAWKPSYPLVIYAIALFLTLACAEIVAPLWVMPFFAWKQQPGRVMRIVPTLLTNSASSAGADALFLVGLAYLGSRRGRLPHPLAFFAAGTLAQCLKHIFYAKPLLLLGVQPQLLEYLPSMLFGWIASPAGYVLAFEKGLGFLLSIKGQGRWWAGLALAAPPTAALLPGVARGLALGAPFPYFQFVPFVATSILLPVFLRATAWAFETLGIITDAPPT